MADQSSNTGIQSTDVPKQGNDSSALQDQDKNNIPSTQPSTDLQPNANGLNNLKTSELQVKYGPTASKGSKGTNGTILSIILVAVILIIAAALFIASLRVPEKAKPTVAPGGEEAGALGTKKKFKRNKKTNKHR